MDKKLREQFKLTEVPRVATKISRSYTLEAMHYLDKLPPLHKCRRPHGHSYNVIVMILGMPDDAGLVCGVEFDALDVIMRPLIEATDHHSWNDLLETPTVEHIAAWFAFMLEQYLAPFNIEAGNLTVRVHEGPRSWAEVSL